MCVLVSVVCFADQPIAFRTTTATSLLHLQPNQDWKNCRGSAVLTPIHCWSLCNSVQQTKLVAFASAARLACWSNSVPGYSVMNLPDADEIVAAFRRGGRFATEHGIRITFHPDQFVVMNSSRVDVVEKSIQDLEYHAEVAEWVGADVINIHGGGAYGEKAKAMATFARNLDRLSDAVRSRLTIENDDKVYTPADLLPLCRAAGLPLVYDVHHHRCLPDGITVEQATTEALATWNREPLFHISSPLSGWKGTRPQRHHDYIDPADFPSCWAIAVTHCRGRSESKGTGGTPAPEGFVPSRPLGNLRAEQERAPA